MLNYSIILSWVRQTIKNFNDYAFSFFATDSGAIAGDRNVLNDHLLN
ncbi:MAG: hypothetical protein HC785_07335 [Calothrix sp. CSU_2_0]|nr:hypothetical protein [Calothrix sp. CSU_2_0]